MHADPQNTGQPIVIESTIGTPETRQEEANEHGEQRISLPGWTFRPCGPRALGHLVRETPQGAGFATLPL